MVTIHCQSRRSILQKSRHYHQRLQSFQRRQLVHYPRNSYQEDCLARQIQRTSKELIGRFCSSIRKCSFVEASGGGNTAEILSGITRFVCDGLSMLVWR